MGVVGHWPGEVWESPTTSATPIPRKTGTTAHPGIIIISKKQYFVSDFHFLLGARVPESLETKARAYL